MIFSNLLATQTSTTYDLLNMHVCLFQITGGSLGIGKCIAIEAAKRGAHVTLVARNALNLEKAAAEVRQAAKESSQKVQCLSSKKKASQFSLI